MKALIVVPCFNAKTTIAKCAEACLQQDYPELEIIFVDDGSTDSTRKILQQYKGITVLQQENKGPAAARNTGWRASSVEIVCFTDADCIPNPQWISGLVQNYQDPDVAAAGGSYDIANRDSWLARCIHAEIRERHVRMPYSVDFLGSFNVSFRRSVLEQVGGFDETFKRASAEDNDLSYRVRKLGNKMVFDAGNCVAHFHTESFWRYMRQQFWHGYWRIRLYVKHPDTLGGDQYAGLSDFLQLPLALITGLAWILSWISWPFLALALGLNTILFLAQMPMVIKMIRKTNDYKYFPFGLVAMSRAFMRGLGMLRALLKTSPAQMLVLSRAFHRK